MKLLSSPFYAALAVTVCSLTTHAATQEPQIQTIVFDLGGVVVGDSSEAEAKWVSESFGIDSDTVQQTLPAALKPVIRGEIQEEAAFLRMARDNGKVLPSDWRKQLVDGYPQWAPVHEEVVTLIKCLQHHGYTTALLSDTTPLHAQLESNRGTHDLFSSIFLSTKTHMTKPTADAYRNVVQTLDVSPESCVYIDDKEKNVDAAEELGMRGIHFTNIEDLRRSLESMDIDTECEFDNTPGEIN